MSEIPVPLTPGYRYTEPGSTIAIELVSLMRQVEIGWDIDDDYLYRRNDLIGDENASFIDVGVRSNDGELVGFGSVAYSAAEGEMGDFVVSPAHQNGGLGKAIIAERIRRAELAGVDTLFIPYLESTNTLASYYLTQGFLRTASGMLIRGAGAKMRASEIIGDL